jgi:glyoxylase-like metal-dependent hydrolase (beta-lactamase superfamily II)
MSAHGLPSVSPAALREKIEAGERLLLLDTRDGDTHRSFPFEATGPVRLLNLPYDEFLGDVERGLIALPAPAEAGRVVTFCYRGGTSVAVARALRRAGYDAVNLEGGMRGWSEQVVPVVVPDSEAALGAGAALVQLRRLGKGCLGYAVLTDGEALLVDVGRNAEAALLLVESRGSRVVRVADTHLHADHISGGPAVASDTGATYSLPHEDGAGVAAKFAPVRDGETWRLGTVTVRAVHTPGHTDGSTSYLVGERYLLTGDTLFVTGVGRPDLSGQGERLARVLHRTLTATLPALPDDLVVLPAHISGTRELGQGGVAAARLGDLKRTTLGRLEADPDAFARRLLASLPEQPPNYETIRAANRGTPVQDPSELEYGPNRCAVTK